MDFGGGMNVWIGAAVFSALSVCLVASPKIAKSRSGDYVTARAIGGCSTVDDISENASGTLQINNSEDVVAGLEIALGYDWSVKGVPVRSEIAYHHRFRFDFDVRIIDGTIVNGFENNLRSDVVLVNLFYDIELQSMWRPYVGGGVGWVHNTSMWISTVSTWSVVPKRTARTPPTTWLGGLGSA